MSSSLFPWPFAGMAELAEKAEAFDTPPWAAAAILDCEILTRRVLDPCCGHGTLSEAAKGRGYDVESRDLHDWGYGNAGIDFLNAPIADPSRTTVFMNPPFSLAVDFVEHALRQRVRKIVAFQKFSWRESNDRVAFWRERDANRAYVCADRASCWRFDIPPEERKGTGTPTTHAWFVWERGHPRGCLVGSVSRPRLP
jgi:predicted RNA methylase